MNKKGLTFLLGAAIVIVIAVVAYTGLTTNDEADKEEENKEGTFDPDPEPDTTQLTYKDNEWQFKQTKREEELLADYAEANYSFDDPFVVTDPYDVAPLTALIKFETEEPAEISVTVKGKDDASTISKTYEGYQKQHEIPVLGLYANTENDVTLQAENEAGETQEKRLTIKTGELPDDILTNDVIEADKDKMESGLTFLVTSGGKVRAIDANGDVRWYSPLSNRHIFKRLENGHLLYVTQHNQEGDYSDLLEMDMLGHVTNAYKVQIDGYDGHNLLHHDVAELPNGNLLATTHEPNGDYVEDQMDEIDRDTGKTVRHLNNRDLFPKEAYEDYDGKNADKGDWFHQNAIWWDDRDNSILISPRSQDSIIKESYPEGNIQWILGAHEQWPDDYDQYLLEPSGDVKFPAGQHAVKTLPDMDDNPDTVDVLLFDNNDVITRGDEDVSDDYSRGVQYRINEEDMTVKEIWSYGEERGKSFFSTIVGNTQYLPDSDDILITSGYIKPDGDSDHRFSNIVEVNHDDPADVVFEFKTEEFEPGSHQQIYRAIRMPLYPDQSWDYSLD